MPGQATWRSRSMRCRIWAGKGMHYLLGCNGSGVAMMTYLGWQTARKIAGVANRPSAFDTEDFPTHPLYSGNPWFLPAIGGWYRLRDSVDRGLAMLASR